MVEREQALIDQAKADWKSGAAEQWRGRFTLPPEETEFIPLPEG